MRATPLTFSPTSQFARIARGARAERWCLEMVSLDGFASAVIPVELFGLIWRGDEPDHLMRFNQDRDGDTDRGENSGDVHPGDAGI